MHSRILQSRGKFQELLLRFERIAEVVHAGGTDGLVPLLLQRSGQGVDVGLFVASQDLDHAIYVAALGPKAAGGLFVESGFEVLEGQGEVEDRGIARRNAGSQVRELASGREGGGRAGRQGGGGSRAGQQGAQKGTPGVVGGKDLGGNGYYR